jgi:hypothetical protein
LRCVRSRVIQLGDRAGRDGERLAERQALAARPNLKLGHLSARGRLPSSDPILALPQPMSCGTQVSRTMRTVPIWKSSSKF